MKTYEMLEHIETQRKSDNFIIDYDIALNQKKTQLYVSRISFYIDDTTRLLSKVHHLRNLYSSLLADMKAETISDADSMVRRNQLEQLENDLYTQSAPHTTSKAVEMATKALKINQDSTTTDEEIQLILPEHLKI